MFVALLTLCGVYVLAYERRIIDNMRQFLIVLGLVIVTVGLTMLAGTDSLRAELIPLLLFGMTISIAYHQESALLFSAALALVVVVSIGQGMYEFIILNAAVATAILLVGPIRSRWKLIYVGLCVGVVVMLTTIGVGTLAEQPFYEMVLPDAIRFGLWSLLATIVMSGADAAGRKAVRRADRLEFAGAGRYFPSAAAGTGAPRPGTYNHSINVASIAEAAAESIHARGLLVRVGAYFHDIGKMLKPAYFVENQGNDSSRHDTLVPAMSTLIIIAHVKDGADLARQHHLPEALLDFIQQHHGTTLVEYFYHRANERSETDPDGGEVEESAFRYPGPKPQTKEAAVLMLADAVEGASRALAEPTPARIESLVHDIAMKRLLDGQFDECSLTLRELATVEDSLIKSLTAVYHGRIKYPDQRPIRNSGRLRPSNCPRPVEAECAADRMLTIEINNDQALLAVDEERLRQAVENVLRSGGIATAEVSVAIVDDPTIHRLNVRVSPARLSDRRAQLSFGARRRSAGRRDYRQRRHGHAQRQAVRLVGRRRAVAVRHSRHAASDRLRRCDRRVARRHARGRSRASGPVRPRAA